MKGGTVLSPQVINLPPHFYKCSQTILILTRRAYVVKGQMDAHGLIACNFLPRVEVAEYEEVGVFFLIRAQI